MNYDFHDEVGPLASVAAKIRVRLGHRNQADGAGVPGMERMTPLYPGATPYFLGFFRRLSAMFRLRRHVRRIRAWGKR